MAECSCESCQRACQYAPGWFLPGEAEKAAELMGLTLQEFFDSHLQVDWWIEDEGETFVLRPVTAMARPGQEAPANSRGVCSFYQNGLCAIHAAKPFECRELTHDDDHDTVYNRHEAVAVAWRENQDQIRELLDREPVAEESSLCDWLW